MTTHHHHWIALVADVGGTNARFALVDESLQCHNHQTLAVADYPNLLDAIQEYLRPQGLACPPVAGIAVACPADQEEVAFTNSHWRFHKHKLREQIGCDELLVVNDFVALAYGVSDLENTQLHKIGHVAGPLNGNRAVIGPGTGFGVAGLLYHGAQWLPISGEGGHIEWAPLDPLEREVQGLLLRTLPRLSIERVLQGKGITLIYKAICEITNEQYTTDDIAEIVTRGLQGACPACRSTLELYCNVLGSVAGDIALLFGARGGVFFGGGILPRLLNFIEHTRLRARFEHKGRMSDYNRRIPCFVITAPLRALDGMVTALQMHRLLLPGHQENT